MVASRYAQDIQVIPDIISYWSTESKDTDVKRLWLSLIYVDFIRWWSREDALAMDALSKLSDYIFI